MTAKNVAVFLAGANAGIALLMAITGSWWAVAINVAAMAYGLHVAFPSTGSAA